MRKSPIGRKKLDTLAKVSHRSPRSLPSPTSPCLAHLQESGTQVSVCSSSEGLRQLAVAARGAPAIAGDRLR
eukprot:766356-Hanusia_phi.AAC.2